MFKKYIRNISKIFSQNTPNILDSQNTLHKNIHGTNQFNNKLTSIEFSQNYYLEHKNAGLDYLGHGFWQESYANMVVDATFQQYYSNPTFLDIGCACGSILKGFKSTKIFNKLVGIDINKYMITTGREYFGFDSNELIRASASSLPIPNKSMTLIHSAQVFEHLPESILDNVISEIYRTLTDDGRIFIALDAVRNDETPELYMGDPTHVTLRSPIFWSNIFDKYGFIFDIESYDRYARSTLGPTQGDPSSFFTAYKWSVWILRKKTQ